ncbi:MAG TPA: hypothetical protein VFJ72_08480 [Rubrobacteraceae bacterium]|nr:hypothetical protein [Rubrobacteraceae bacterium]
MGLIRTILALVILVILAHVGMVYAGVERATNGLTDALYSLGELLESPATIILNAISSSGQLSVDTGNFYVVALTAAAAYFVLYLLLGIGRRG